MLVALGALAAQSLLNTTAPLSQLRGTRHQLGTRPLIVTHHPAHLLRALLDKADAWTDLQFALSVYHQLETAPCGN
jgi:DNA polymerase